MNLGTILLIILILLLVGALPTWPYSSGWGYYPTGGLGLVHCIIYFRSGFDAIGSILVGPFDWRSGLIV
ncbi:MAG: DUF3309 family protein [Chthoniobacterales bacterium]